ncbi:MAG: endoglucanase, partial [Lysinibacillus sp.]
MAKKRNTKLALASLMAVSAITPVVASADTNGSVTTEAGTSRSTEAQVAKTIDFTVQEETGMLARFVKGPGTLVERSGQQYIQLNLTDAVLNMITAVTVDGKTALHEFGGKKMVLIPVSADYAPVAVDFAITSPVGAGEYKATLTPDASSIKE